MSDTGSLIYHVTKDDVCKDMLSDINLFDTSDYPIDHPCYCTLNKKKK